MFIRNLIVAVSLGMASSALAETTAIDVSQVDFADPAQAALVYDSLVGVSNDNCQELNNTRSTIAECTDLAINDAVYSAGFQSLIEVHESRGSQSVAQ